MSLTPSSKNKTLLDAQLELWHHTLCYIKPMALKSAIDLHIADAIHDHGGNATLRQIAAKVRIHRSKLPYLGRLMRVLTVTGVFSVELPTADGRDEHVYGLTSATRLLLSSTTTNLSPTLTFMLHSAAVSPFLHLGEWFLRELPDPSVFEMAHGQNFWDFASHDVKLAKIFDDAMIADSRFAMDIIVKECGNLFHGISSLIDVAGGLGGASQSISKAVPHVKCSVLDLPHIVARAPAGTDVDYIAGDMFESIPPANAVFLKVLHVLNIVSFFR